MVGWMMRRIGPAIVMVAVCAVEGDAPKSKQGAGDVATHAAREAATRPAGVELDAIRLRDPFILPVAEEGRYYLFGTGFPLEDGPGFVVYASADLERFTGPKAAFRRREGFWADRHYWAPEVHRYRDGYYMFASFNSEDERRGTQILASASPSGPYRPHSRGPVTPRAWECLDGTLYLDGDKRPWMVFCHEWVQVGDGEMCAMRLREDLSAAVGEPVLLFKASDAPWVVPFDHEGKHGRVTDGPFLHRTEAGALLMIWSSFGKKGYTTGVARSVSGKLSGPWVQEPEPLYANDGGHGMIFRTFDKALMLVLHQPNSGRAERPRLLRVEEKGDRLVIAGECGAE